MTTTTTTGTVTAGVAALDRALGAVIPFAERAPSGARHVLQLRAGGGWLTVTATDGYVAGRVRQPATGRIEQPFLLDRTHAQLLHDAVRCHLTEVPDLPITLDVTDAYLQRRLTVAAGEVTFRFAAANLPATNLDVVFAAPRRPGGDTPIGITAAQLAPFGEAATWAPGQAMRWAFHGPGRPSLVTLGDWFTGALMPQPLPEPPERGAHR